MASSIGGVLRREVSLYTTKTFKPSGGTYQEIVIAGSHHDLAGLSTSTDQSHFYSKLDGSQAVLAEPNIGVKMPIKTPPIHLQGGQQTETTDTAHHTPL